MVEDSEELVSDRLDDHLPGATSGADADLEEDDELGPSAIEYSDVTELPGEKDDFENATLASDGTSARIRGPSCARHSQS